MVDEGSRGDNDDGEVVVEGVEGADRVAMRKRRGRGGAAALGAAMLAVGEILEPEKTVVEMVQTDDDPDPDLPFTLEFGDLPPL